jgi:hypothetical protein
MNDIDLSHFRVLMDIFFTYFYRKQYTSFNCISKKARKSAFH